MGVIKILLGAGLLLIGTGSSAKGVYLEPKAFLEQAFGAESYVMRSLWLNQEDKQQGSEIFNRDYQGFRLRYWQAGEKTAWIMDEIGKTRPITFGVLIRDGQIEKVEVLEFRESRGGEIRHPFFTSQFTGLSLKDGQLSDSIDGITGATLSVKAAKRIARFALYLHGRTDLAARSSAVLVNE